MEFSTEGGGATYFYYLLILSELSHLTKYNDNRITIYSDFSLHVKTGQLEVFSNSFSNCILVLSIIWQKSLDNWKKSFTNGSLKLTRKGKFKLVGSKINWHNCSGFTMMSSKLILFFVWVVRHLNCVRIRSLSVDNPLHTEITWLIVSSTPDVQIMHRCDPPDWFALIW